ncbi:sensor histidine kinase [Radicibacter daui]|uniref:sensor histidine kinase n=1 Tax=Radicibacter daui TaxID=3064829 RepID=UPI004046F0BF
MSLERWRKMARIHGTLLWLIALILTIIALMAGTLGWTTYAVRNEQAATDGWRDYGRNAGELYTVIGYNGFIHNFKNWVLRGEEEFYVAARQNFAVADKAMDRLLTLTPPDLAPESVTGPVATIRQTLDRYEGMLDKVRLYRSQQLGIGEIDQRVKVDDAGAAAAITELRRMITAGISGHLSAVTRLAALQLALTTALLAALPVAAAALYLLARPILNYARLRHAAEAHRDILAGVIRGLDDAVLVVDMTATIVIANSRADQLFGYGDGVLEGMTVHELVPDATRGHHDALVKGFFTGSAREKVIGRWREIKGRRADGSLFPLILNIHKVESEADTFVSVLVRSLENQDVVDAQLSREEAIAANRIKTRFLRLMSHEMRTPLNAIIGFSSIIADEMYGPGQPREYIEYAGDINVAGNHMLRLVNDVLEFSRYSDGSAALELETTDMLPLVQSILRAFESAAAGRGVSLRLEADPAGDWRGLAEGAACRRALHHILDNAVRYNTAGGAVTVLLRGNRSFVGVAVIDTGPGFKAADTSRLLSPFERGGEAADLFGSGHADGGLGLGLPIAARVMELQGGRLEIESTPGEGTRVDLYFGRPREMFLPAPARQSERVTEPGNLPDGAA